MIKLQIIGNLGKDCIVKEINGKNVINFSVAHTERFKDSTGAQRERTTWVECAYWTDRTAIAPYLKKGQLVFAEGSVEAEGYMNKENQAAATLRMRVRDIQLLGGRTDGNQSNSGTSSSSYSTSNSSPSSASSSNGNNNNAEVAASMEEAADDLPF
ncbi:MAG: single-stranded DNA-binding protein [Bacteroidota bacterium]|nr:single-stranded DNA-binding protein [Bacteroidota bacterium]MDQ6888893.1 single-stranded DNA-binding protein [Bacteroidota bacterium]